MLDIIEQREEKEEEIKAANKIENKYEDSNLTDVENKENLLCKYLFRLLHSSVRSSHEKNGQHTEVEKEVER